MFVRRLAPEANTMADTYPIAFDIVPAVITSAYEQQADPVIENQLEKAGIRLAYLLNVALKEPTELGDAHVAFPTSDVLLHCSLREPRQPLQFRRDLRRLHMEHN